jgi:tocopherol O-methyltransferase
MRAQQRPTRTGAPRLTHHAQVADVGCGNGGTALLVARQLGCSVVGVNISPHQVQSANALAQRCGFDHSKLRFVVGDALEPPLPAGAFDLVLAVESSTYMPDKE